MNKKIFELRRRMKLDGVDYLIIPISDPHLSEYIAGYYKALEWVSGFSGSAGTLVISQNKAGLWTDSRYFIQAEKEIIKTSLVLHKVTNSGSDYLSWISEVCKTGETVGLDGRLLSKHRITNIQKELKVRQLQLLTDIRYIDDVWKSERPPLSQKSIFDFDVRYAGLPRFEKIREIRLEMKKAEVEWHLITMLDDVAWTFNLRGKDIDFNPVFYSFGLLGEKEAYLFVEEEKISKTLIRELEKDRVYVQPYNKAYALNDLAPGKILVNPEECNYELYARIDINDRKDGPSIPGKLKSRKTSIEIQHIENAMVKDGVALTHAFFWLEEKLRQESISEFVFSNKLSEFRAKQEGYFGESFSPIVGYNENGAIVHYRPHRNNSDEMTSSGILLCDSGAQYIDGTTDITRTIALSEPSSHQRGAYTRVLKGHIALATIEFPKGTTGGQLDVLARQFLWSCGMDYGHGTGHGVGYFLNVHEAPQGYSTGQSKRATTVLEPGMLISNEPGFYQKGEYGIRIENLQIVEESDHPGFLRHRTMTIFPIDTTLLKTNLLDAGEVQWLNSYHQVVFDTLSPLLDDVHRDWLKEKCRPI